MIRITQSPLEAHHLREIQKWLQQGQCGKFKGHIKGLIAYHQEAASRLLIASVDDPRREADAKSEAEKASHLLRFIATLDAFASGEAELPITKITIEQ
jgi:hypothetical protein